MTSRNTVTTKLDCF